MFSTPPTTNRKIQWAGGGPVILLQRISTSFEGWRNAADCIDCKVLGRTIRLSQQWRKLVLWVRGVQNLRLWIWHGCQEMEPIPLRRSHFKGPIATINDAPPDNVINWHSLIFDNRFILIEFDEERLLTSLTHWLYGVPVGASLKTKSFRLLAD